MQQFIHNTLGEMLEVTFSKIAHIEKDPQQYIPTRMPKSFRISEKSQSQRHAS
ncbi:MAG: hypothetical protein ACI849_000118 [Patiriisocius sp.]|jgi:hypothetical protein